MKPQQDQIPPKSAIIPFYLAGAVSLFAACLLSLIAAPDFLGHYFQPRMLAITHLVVLGWATMLIFGASNQLAPVISEQRLWSNRIPVAVLACMVSGVALLVTSFWSFSLDWMAFTGGGLLLFSFILHAVNLYRTVRPAKEHIVNDFMLTAHVWLVLTGVIGLMLLVNLRYPFLPEDHLFYLRIHANVGMAGWFVQLVVGVSAKLIPMFMLSREERPRYLTFAYYLFNAGLVLFLIEGMVFKTVMLRPVSIAVFTAGLLFYFRYVHVCYRSAMKKVTDQGMKQTFMALTLLSLPLILLVCSYIAGEGSSARLVTAYGFAFLGGFITVLIMGQTFKTLPFIIWMHIVRPDELPDIQPKDLYKEQAVRIQALVYLPGFFLLLSGILLGRLWFVYAGTAMMTLAALIYLIHMITLINKLRSYEPQPHRSIL